MYVCIYNFETDFIYISVSELLNAHFHHLLNTLEHMSGQHNCYNTYFPCQSHSLSMFLIVHLG